MRHIRLHMLPAFIAGHGLAAFTHFVGLFLLHRIKFRPANQRIVLIHLAFAELCINITQTIVYAFLMTGRCQRNSICDYVDRFVFGLFSGTSKLIMICITCDRLLEIVLNLKYPIYVTKQRVKKIIVVLWTFSGAFYLIIVLIDIFKIATHILTGTLCYSLLIAKDVVIFITALLTYSFLYMKVKRFRALDQSQKRAQKCSKSSHKSKFLLPCLVIATYLMFNTTGDVLIIYNKYLVVEGETYIKAMVSEVGHWLWILGWISDGILYIYLQKSIKERLRYSLRNKHVPPTK